MPRVDEALGKGEVILPFPHGLGRAAVHAATQFRATWLAGSLRAIRERGHFQRYLEHLPPSFHEPILQSVAGTWLPTPVALAHYAACDKLKLPVPELVEIGREVTRQVHGTVLGFIVKVAKGAGVTPWSVLVKLGDLWARVWVGGGVCVVKLGPKEARIEVAGWPCAGTTYCRVAMRGICAALLELFCEKAYANEIPALCTPQTLGYRLSWV
jgi:hypothetical protein